MLRDYLESAPWFESGEWDSAGTVSSGIVRSR
jgi:hypothetical protein